MAIVSIDASEVERLADDMRQHAARVEPHAEQIVSKSIHDVVASAQSIAPVDTGNLKGSIGADVDGLEAVAGPTAEYGAYVEYGTSRMSAQPYMGPAFNRALPKFERALGKLGSRVLD